MVARLQHLKFCLFEMYVNVVFVIRRLYSAVSLTLVKTALYKNYLLLLLLVLMVSVDVITLQAEEECKFN